MHKTSGNFQRKKRKRLESGLFIKNKLGISNKCGDKLDSWLSNRLDGGLISRLSAKFEQLASAGQVLLAIFYLMLVFSGWIFQSSLAFWQVVSHVLTMVLLVVVFVLLLKLAQKIWQLFLIKLVKGKKLGRSQAVLAKKLAQEKKEQERLVQEKKNCANNFELFMLLCMALIVYPGNLVYLYRWGVKESLLGGVEGSVLEVGLAGMSLPQSGGGLIYGFDFDLIWRKFSLWQYWRVPVLVLVVLALIIIFFELIRYLLRQKCLLSWSARQQSLLSRSARRQSKKYLLGKKQLLRQFQQLFFKIKDKLKINFFSLRSVAATALIVLVFFWGNSSYRLTKQWQNPLIAWQEICLVLPQDIQAWQIYASLLAELAEANCLTEAKSAYLHILQFNPSNVEVLTSVGQLMLRENRDAEARHYFIQALRVNPNYLPAQEGMRKIERLED